MTEVDEIEMRKIVKTFVDDVLKAQMSEENDDPDVTMAAVLIDVAIEICLRRGQTPESIARAALEHARLCLWTSRVRTAN